MIHVILGPDSAFARQAAKQRARSSDPEGHGTSTLDGRSVSLNDVLMAAASIGFFAAGRTIIVEDLLARYAKGTGKGAEADWATLFNGIPAESTLILLDPSVLTLPAVVKKALPKSAEVVISDPPRGRDLIDWIVARVQAQGSRIEPRVAQQLAATLYPSSWGAKGRNPAFDRPPDMEALGNEVDKLVIAAHPNPLTEREIEALIAAGEHDNVFAFIDAATAGQTARAVSELDKLLAAGEDPHKIFSQLCGSAELAAVMATAGRRDPVEVGRELKLANPNRMTGIARSLREQPRGMAPRVASVLAETDRKMKTGELRDPVAALYAAVAAIAPLRRGA
jgi:DNA polymerase III delta subunit